MKVSLYDTTLRDGTQGEGVCFSVEDKLLVARKLDELGIDYIEGGWPGSNARDEEFFRKARSLVLGHARLTSFGSTCHPNLDAAADPNLNALLASETEAVTIFGKSWDLHVRRALGVSAERNLEMIESSVAYLKSHGREVIYDAEHFFDGFESDSCYALLTLVAAERGGADWIVLCDTNGGTVPARLVEILEAARASVGVPLGIHAHNDSEMAVANSIAAVQRGVRQVQGTINGYGERCGNANLCSVLPVLELKLGLRTIGARRLSALTHVSRFVAELANLPPRHDQPFVGRSAFAHKGGVHVSAVMKDPSTYEHIDPESTGNLRRVLVSDLAGKSNILYKAAEMGIDVTGRESSLRSVVHRIKELEHAGFEFEAAEGSLRLLVEEALGNYTEFFRLESYGVRTEMDLEGRLESTAVVRVVCGESMREGRATASGPVHALDLALRAALSEVFECLGEVTLTDYSVRVLESDRATAARVRVLIESGDGVESWRTVGVSESIIEASRRALTDGINYKLLRSGASSPVKVGVDG